MAKSKFGLGKGLDAIFLDNTAPESGAAPMLRVSDMKPRKDQPRKNFSLESLQQLADSIKDHGLIQPIVVRETLGGNYEIIAGERRWRAAQMLGMSEVPAVIMQADDRRAAELSIIENVQREDLDPIEEASAYKKLRDDFGLTQDKVADAVGKSRSAVANILRLLDLPEEVQRMVASGTISEGHAKVLLGCNYEEDLIKAARTVADKQLTVRATETLVRQLNLLAEAEERTDEPLTVTGVRVNYTKVLETKASKLLGRKVAISGRGKTKRLVLFYEDKEDLETILKTLCGNAIFEDDVE